MIDPAELRDLIKQYGAEVDDEAYKDVYDFGIWFADKQDASDVVLSDWTPVTVGKGIIRG
ncbi:MAG TPA: hypothetical protein VL866_24125 [Pyrinomonadaceae bacterium]|nr:hypothetical protein [Pyrinomonadaceae bacterium]